MPDLYITRFCLQCHMHYWSFRFILTPHMSEYSSTAADRVVLSFRKHFHTPMYRYRREAVTSSLQQHGGSLLNLKISIYT